jgi:hypothetical protein
MSKMVLFYSNYCVHCRQLMGDITKHGLRERFALVCVDTRASLPDAVDRVPMALDPGSRRMYVDDAVFQLVAEMVDGVARDVQAYYGQHTGFSDDFSFLDVPTEDVFSLNYAAHDGCQTQITTPPDDAKRSSAESTALDQLRTQRDQDISLIQASMPRPLA